MTFAERHALTSRVLATAIVLAILAICVGAVVTSWDEPHAAVAIVVGLIVSVAFQLAFRLDWRRRRRVSPGLTITTGLLSVLSMSWICLGSGWLRALGGAILLPLVLGTMIVVLAGVAATRRT